MNKLSQQDVEKELIAITNKMLIESGEPYRREIKLNASLQRHLGIDSLGRAELFQRIEKSFNVHLPDKLLMEAEYLNDIAVFLQNSDVSSIKIPTKHEMIQHTETSSVDPSHANSLIDILLQYGEETPDRAHIYFQREDGSNEVITYGQLLQSSLRVAHGLRELGLQENETVAIMQPTHPNFFYTFFGILLAGGVPVPIYPPFRMHMLEAYAKTEAHILRNAEVRILVTFDQAEKLSLLLKSFVPSLKHVTTVEELIHTEELHAIFKAKSHNFAFIQYTSGSTSDPKGVLLSHHNLLSNIQAYGKAIQVTPSDVAVSWLPLYHDMGLIGMWLGSLYYGIPLVLLTPFSFLNHPEKWLWAIHNHRATLSGAPNFAYELCVRKITPELIEGLDLSSWRMAANGAEKVYPRTLDEFAKKFAPYGFKRSTLLPVYGLAESTVALTVPPVNRDFIVDKVDRKQFEKNRTAVPSQETKALEFVSCGPPMINHEVRIVNDDYEILPERHVGNLQFRGPSSMQGYFNNPKATRAIYHDGWLDSGDLAYQVNGEIYVTGRRKDLIIKAGRNIYPAEIEEIVGTIQGVRQGCVTAFGVSEQEKSTEELVIVAEVRNKDKTLHNNIIAKINDAIVTNLDIVPDQIMLVSPHVVPKTSSGKLQRAACKKMFLEGRLNERQMPAWLQIIRLSVKSFYRRGITSFKMLAKVFYTAYVAIIVSFTFFPLALLLQFLSRDHAMIVARTWAKWILRFSFCPVTVIGRELLTQNLPVIFTPNHASYLDSIFMLSILPINARIVAKKEVFSIPIVRSVLRKMDYLSVDRLDLTKGLEDTKYIESVLKAGNPILIFPEGTFGYAAGLRPFRLGAFKISTETQIPVCPVALKGTRFVLRDDEKLMWPHRVTVKVCPLIYPKGTEWQDVTNLRNEVRTQVAKYCGEPSLDFIAAQTVAPKQMHRN